MFVKKLAVCEKCGEEIEVEVEIEPSEFCPY